MTVIATILPPDVAAGDAQRPQQIERLYVYGDGGLWLLDGPAMRIVADGTVGDWLNAAEDTGARQNWKTGKWSKLPKDVYATGYNPAPLGSSDSAARVVSYDEDIPALCREIAAEHARHRAAGGPSAEDRASLRKPHVAQALAYVLATGWMPKRMHMQTWSVVHHASALRDVDQERRQSGPMRFYDVKPWAREVAEKSPLGRALRLLLDAGYTYTGHKPGGRWIEFRRNAPDGLHEHRATIMFEASGKQAPWWFEEYSFETAKMTRRTRDSSDGGQATALPEFDQVVTPRGRAAPVESR